jgi:hypothetical protein
MGKKELIQWLGEYEIKKEEEKVGKSRPMMELQRIRLRNRLSSDSCRRSPRG